MSSKEILMTQEGLDKIKDEVEQLKIVKRKEVAEKIKTALAFGDISENSEYDEAKNEQADLEKRILKLEMILRDATVVDESQINKDEVGIGCDVKLKDLDENEVRISYRWCYRGGSFCW